MKFISAAGLVCAAALLVACGGGGGSGSTSATPSAVSIPQGAYEGTVSGSSSPSLQLLVLEDGTLWSTYGALSAGTFLVKGFVQASATFGASSYTASNARDFGFAPSVAANLTGTYDATPTIRGTLSHPGDGAMVTFSATPIDQSHYNYHVAARLADVAGGWNVVLSTGETSSLNVSVTGAVGGISSSGSSYSGQFTPRASGKNVFDVSLRFNTSPCALNGQTATGVAVSYPLANGQRQLLVLAVDASRAFGVSAFGAR